MLLMKGMPGQGSTGCDIVDLYTKELAQVVQTKRNIICTYIVVNYLGEVSDSKSNKDMTLE